MAKVAMKLDEISREMYRMKKRSGLGQNLEERHYLRGREKRPKGKEEDIEKIVGRS